MLKENANAAQRSTVSTVSQAGHGLNISVTDSAANSKPLAGERLVPT